MSMFKGYTLILHLIMDVLIARKIMFYVKERKKERKKNMDEVINQTLIVCFREMAGKKDERKEKIKEGKYREKETEEIDTY